MIIPAMRSNRRRLITPMTFRGVVAVVSIVSVAFVSAVDVVVVAAATVPLQYVPVKLPTHTHVSFLVLELNTQLPLLWHVLDSHIGPQCVLRHSQLYESVHSRYLHFPRLHGFLQGRSLFGSVT